MTEDTTFYRVYSSESNRIGQDELFIVVSTNKDYDYLYVLDEKRMILQKRELPV